MFDGTVLDVINKIARFPRKENLSDLLVETVLVSNMSMFDSGTRFNHDIGKVFIIIGTEDAPDYDVKVSDLNSDSKRALVWLLVCIEHEKRHAMQMLNFFQQRDSRYADLYIDFLFGKVDSDWYIKNYRNDTCESDAIVNGVKVGCEIASRLFGSEFAESAVLDMYDSKQNDRACEMAISVSRYQSVDELVSYAEAQMQSNGLLKGFGRDYDVREINVVKRFCENAGACEVRDILDGSDDTSRKALVATIIVFELIEPYYYAFKPMADSITEGHSRSQQGVRRIVESSDELQANRAIIRESYNNEVVVRKRRKNAVCAQWGRLPFVGRWFDPRIRKAIKAAGKIEYTDGGKQGFMLVS